MRLSYYLLTAAIVLFAGCNNAQDAKEEIKTNTAAVTDSVTNPLFKIAPLEYAVLSEQAFQHMAHFEFDDWAAMLADSVVYSFPNGDAATRTTLKGKTNVINWWKNWRDTSGINSMTMDEFNHIPINVYTQPKGGFPMGIWDIVYFTNTMVFNGKPVGLRMNFSVHFNAGKLIDHYASYYDRNVIIQATGKNVLK